MSKKRKQDPPKDREMTFDEVMRRIVRVKKEEVEVQIIETDNCVKELLKVSKGKEASNESD